MARIHPTTPPSSLTPPASTAPGAAAAGLASASVEDRVQKVLELIRPAVQADGGDIEFVGLTADSFVQIRMHGACVGCPSSAVTLQTGIERNLRQHVPEVRGVRVVD